MIDPIELVRRRRRSRRQALLYAQTMPSVVTLLAVLTAAGQHPRNVIVRLVDAEPRGNLGVVAEQLGPVSRSLALGASFADAIASGGYASPAHRALQRVLDLLRRGEVDGLDLATQLDIAGNELRRDRTVALDTAAQRLTVTLLFPLVLCILPAFVLLAIVPLLLDVFSQLPAVQ